MNFTYYAWMRDLRPGDMEFLKKKTHLHAREAANYYNKERRYSWISVSDLGDVWRVHCVDNPDTCKEIVVGEISTDEEYQWMLGLLSRIQLRINVLKRR